MSQRVRERGPRRRCSSNRTLVRTIPGLQTEPPPVPSLSANARHYVPSVISDYEGIATASWSFINRGTTPSVLDRNIAYHHFTVTNTRTDSYSAILPPIRWSPLCPVADGGAYDAWQVSPGGVGLRSFNPADSHQVPVLEVAREVIPSDSHCDFNEGFTQAFFSGDLTIGNVPSVGSSTTFAPNITALAPSVLNCNYVNSIYAWEFVVNGAPTGVLKLGNATALKADRLTISKGDRVEIDIWYRTSHTPFQVNNNGPGKGVIGIDLDYTTTGAPIPKLIAWNNINRTVDYDSLSQTYEITIAGHVSGWTLKDGSNGPHQMKAGDGWSFTPADSHPQFGGGIRWSRLTTDTFIWFQYLRELPLLIFRPGILGTATTVQTTWFYRPRNQATQSYRKSSVVQNTYFPNGSVQMPAGTITHAPCGPFDQGGTTIFDLVAWNTNLPGFIPGKGPGIVSLDSDTPTSITLTRVPL